MTTRDNQGPGRRGQRPKTIDLEAGEYAAAKDASAEEQAASETPAEPAADVVAAGESLFTPGETSPAPEPGAEHPEEVDPVVGMSAEDREALASVETGRHEDHSPEGVHDGNDPAPAETTAASGEPAPLTQASPAAAAEAPARKGGFVGMLAAAVVGGLVALGAAGGMGAAGLLGSIPGFSGQSGVPAATDSAELAQLRDQIAALQAQIAQGGEGAAAPVAADPALAERFAAMESRLQAAEDEARQLREALAATPAATAGEGAPSPQLQNQIDDLFARLAKAEAGLSQAGQAPAAADNTAVDALSQRIDAEVAGLSDRVAQADAKAAEAASAAQDATAAVQAIDGRIAGIETSVGEIRTVAEELKTARETANTEGEVLARTVAANALRTAYDKGEPYAGLLASARTLTGDVGALAVLEKFASTGVPTPESLLQSFRAAEQDALAALAPKEDGVMAQLLSNARGLVKVKPAGPQPGDSPEAILSRVEAGLKAGDFAAAQTEWQALPEPARQAAASFGEALQAKVEADAAMNEVIGALAARGQG